MPLPLSTWTHRAKSGAGWGNSFAKEDSIGYEDHFFLFFCLSTTNLSLSPPQSSAQTRGCLLYI